MVEPRRPFPKAHIHLSVQTVSVNKVFERCGLHATVTAVDFIPQYRPVILQSANFVKLS